MTQKPIPHIDAEALDWVNTSWIDGYPEHRFLARVTIAGCDMHLEAHEVHWDEGPGYDTQEFVADGQSLGDIYQAVSAEGPWETVKINGREYVLIATPYCK
jgi:hypothetical protein